MLSKTLSFFVNSQVWRLIENDLLLITVTYRCVSAVAEVRRNGSGLNGIVEEAFCKDLNRGDLKEVIATRQKYFCQ